jgi:hypothetical protein
LKATGKGDFRGVVHLCFLAGGGRDEDLFNSKKLSGVEVHAHVDTAKSSGADEFSLSPSEQRLEGGKGGRRHSSFAQTEEPLGRKSRKSNTKEKKTEGRRRRRQRSHFRGLFLEIWKTSASYDMGFVYITWVTRLGKHVWFI